MSNVYALEPRARGRLVLRTSHGPIEVSLFSNEAPRAARSLVSHAHSGYYDNLPFHRVIPGILAQVGDPTRSGDGGQAATESGFVPREVHGRLKFRRRGLVALVSDDAGRCRGQFFITLGKTEWLDGQHSIVGTVEGDTIFNVLQMAESGEVDGFDVAGGPKLLAIDVVENPYEDMVAKPKSLSTDAAKDVIRDSAAMGGKRAIKNQTLLSFGNEDGPDSDSDSDSDSGDDGEDGTALPKKSKIEQHRLSKKRPRSAGGMLSRYDVIDGSSALPAEEKPVAREEAGLQSDFRPVVPEKSNIIDSKPRRDIGGGQHVEKSEAGSVLRAAEEEFAKLQSQMAAGAAVEAGDLKAGDGDSKSGDPAADTGTDGDGSVLVLPGKYASLQRGVVRKKACRGAAREGAAERLKVLRARVATASGNIEPLVFRAAADAANEDDYEVFDPLEGKRGRMLGVAALGRPGSEDIGRGRGLRRYG